MSDAPVGPLTARVLKALASGQLPEARRQASGPGDAADVHHAKGVVALFDGNSSLALQHLQTGLNLQPTAHAMRIDLGRAQLRAGQAAAAVVTLREALAAAPASLQGWLSLGVAHEALQQDDAAEAAFRQALKLSPRQPAVPYNLGNIAYRRGDFVAARVWYRQSLELHPGFADAWAAIGALEHDCCQWQEAETALRNAIRLDPGSAAPRETLAHILLGSSRWREGWSQYAWRSARLGVGAHVDRPERVYAGLPSVESLKARHVTLIAEQGLGDTLFFLRFAAQIKAVAAQTDFWGDERLFPLLGNQGFGRLIASGQTPSPASLQLRSGDLPLILGSTHPLPSLKLPRPGSAEIEAVSAALAKHGPPPYLGLTWRAGTAGQREALSKCIPLTELATAVKPFKGTLVAVQRQPLAGELQQLEALTGRVVADLTAMNAELELISALMWRMDYYAGVSNTNVHLRTGHGRGSLVLVPLPPEWRWGHAGERSPWHPESVVLREVESGWSAALTQLHSLLP